MHRAKIIVALLLLALGITGCGPAATPEAAVTSAPAAAEIVYTPTPPASVQIDLTTNTASQDPAPWTARCAQNTAGKPIADLPAIEPFKAVVLAFNPGSKQWEANRGFPTLINTTGEPEYLICVFRTWTFFANYSISGSGNVPGYREDWKITVQILDTKEIYETRSLVGQNPPYSVTYPHSNTPITVVVGTTPLQAARSVLLAKQSLPVASATLSIPHGFQSIDFAPDSRSLYVPFEDGFHQWDFTANTQTPLSFQPTPSSCDKHSQWIRTSFDGEYLVTMCYTGGDPEFVTEIWAADTLQQTAKFDASYHVAPQFELQEQGQIISYANLEGNDVITTLDLSTGDVLSTPLMLEKRIIWVSPDATHAVTYSSQAFQIWDLAQQRILNSFGQNTLNLFVNGQVLGMSRNGQMLLTQQNQGGVTIFVWDVPSQQLLLCVTAGAHSTADISPNGQLLAVLNRETVSVIDLQARKLLVTIPVENPGRSILFSPDGTKIALPTGMFYSGEYLSSPVDVAVFGTGLP